MNKKNSEQMSGPSDDTLVLIERLSGCGSPCKPCGCPIRQGLLMFALVAAYMMLIVLYVGIRPNMDDMYAHTRYNAEIAFAVVMSLIAMISSVHLQSPDAYNRGWLVIFTSTLFALLIGYTLWRLATEHMIWYIHHGVMLNIMGNYLAFSLLPMVLIAWHARRGATVHPIGMALLQSLGIGSLAWVADRLTMPMDDMPHAFILPWLATVALGVIFSVVARRLYRW